MESNNFSDEESLSDDETSDDASFISAKKTGKNNFSNDYYAFMMKNSSRKKNAEQDENLEEETNDDESDVQEKSDYEQELIVALDYLDKDTCD